MFFLVNKLSKTFKELTQLGLGGLFKMHHNWYVQSECCQIAWFDLGEHVSEESKVNKWTLIL